MSSLNSEWIPFLRKIVLFSGFTEEELNHLLSKIYLLSLPKGSTLFRQGDEGDALHLIHSGRIRIVKEHDENKTIAYLGKGDVLGESNLLTGEPRSNTALVDRTVDLLVLNKKDFDELLQEIPTMAIQISRLLSSRLVETTKSKSAHLSPTSRLYSLVNFTSPENFIIFSINLAISLVEQSRRKVLLLDVLEEPGVFSKPVGIMPVRVGESSIRLRDLQSPNVLQKITSHHPSGLEMISIPLPIIEGKLYRALYPFLSVLRKNFDVIIIVLPTKKSNAAKIFLEESDKVLALEEEGRSLLSTDLLRTFDHKMPFKKIYKIRLCGKESSAESSTSNFRLPWKGSYVSEFLKTHNPFIPMNSPETQKAMDRLARELTGLRIGFAMGSGAAFGYAIIGMLRVFEKHGIYPDVLAGTSMGALIGSFYAKGKNPDELEQIALSITKAKLFSLADFTLPWQGLVLGRQILKFLKSILGETTFDQLSTPFACVATDIMTGEEIIQTQGKIAEAVRGSLSLPFFFQPYFHQEHFLVDGGLVNPVPTSVIASMGADILISANLTAKPGEKKIPGQRKRRRHSPYYWKGPNLLEVIVKTIYTMQFGIAQTRAEPAHIVLDPDLSQFAWADFHQAKDIIKIGEDYTEEMIPKIKAQIPFFADACRMPIRKGNPFRSY